MGVLRHHLGTSALAASCGARQLDFNSLTPSHLSGLKILSLRKVLGVSADYWKSKQNGYATPCEAQNCGNTTIRNESCAA